MIEPDVQLLKRPSPWPRRSVFQDATPKSRAAFVDAAAGISNTDFSEWLNIVIRAAWAYLDIMPMVPVVDAGLTPLLQWIVVPSLAYWAAIRFPLRRLFGSEDGRW